MRKLFENLYAKINCPHSDFRPSLFDEGREVRDYFLPANLLKLAEVVYQAKKTKEHVSLPLKAAGDSDYRLYCLDMGFLAYQSGIASSISKTSGIRIWGFSLRITSPANLLAVGFFILLEMEK